MEMAQLIPPPHLSGAEAAFLGADLGLQQRVLPQLGLSAAGLCSTCSWLFGMIFCAIGSGTCGSPRLHSMWCWECGNEGFQSAVLLQNSGGARIQGAEELCLLLKNSQGWVSSYQLGISPSLQRCLHVQIGLFAEMLENLEITPISQSFHIKLFLCLSPVISDIAGKGLYLRIFQIF